MGWTQKRSLILLTICFSMLWTACGGSGKATAECPPVDAGRPQFVAQGNEGTISGSITLSGNYQPAPLDMAADAACARKNSQAASDEIVANGGKLQNVFVFIKDGQTANGKKISDFTYAMPATEARIDQNGCLYEPHIIGIRAGQKISFTNSDATVHNINAQPKINEKFNQPQAAGQAPIVKSFCQPEQAIRIKCNQHGWMSAWVNVLNHPFFAISGANGAFTISGVPPGQYTLVAWHEKLGEQTFNITVPEKGAATANFTFAANQTATLGKGSLTLGVLELTLPHAH